MKTKTKFAWCLISAACVPFVAEAFYLFVSRRWGDCFTAFGDWGSVAVSVFLGAVFVALLPVSVSNRVVALFVYVPVVAVSLFYFVFLFLAAVFQNGL